MRVLVCGGRDFADKAALSRMLDELLSPAAEKSPTEKHTIIHGGAKGADTLAGEWAGSNSVETEVFPADWARHGNAAGPIRNQRMLDEGRPDLVVAFPGGRGTADMVGRANSAGLPVLTRLMGGA